MIKFKGFIAAAVLVLGLSFGAMAETADAPAQKDVAKAELVITDQVNLESIQLDDQRETAKPGDTVIAGWVSEEALSPDDMEAFLTLAHGKRRPSAYAVCPSCTIIGCNKQTQLCSGHCKKKAQLFTCRKRL
jgi:hypothetical protein